MVSARWWRGRWRFRKSTAGPPVEELVDGAEAVRQFGPLGAEAAFSRSPLI